MDMNHRISHARLSQSNSAGGSSFLVSGLKKYMTKLPAGSELSQDLDEMGKLMAENEQSEQGKVGKKPADLTPQEMHSRLWAILSLRDKSELDFNDVTVILLISLSSCEKYR